jgi:hypothetical protein
MAHLTRYVVTGSSPILFEGRTLSPGTEFTANISPDQEGFWLACGHISIVPPAVAVPVRSARFRRAAEGEE